MTVVDKNYMDLLAEGMLESIDEIKNVRPFKKIPTKAKNKKNYDLDEMAAGMLESLDTFTLSPRKK